MITFLRSERLRKKKFSLVGYRGREEEKRERDLWGWDDRKKRKAAGKTPNFRYL